MIGGELERVDCPQDFVEIAARARGIDHAELELFVRTDDVDRPDGEGVARVRVDHSVEIRDLAIRIGNEREVQSCALRLLDVVSPLLVLGNGID